MSTMLDSRLCFAKSRGRSDGTPTVDSFAMGQVPERCKCSLATSFSGDFFVFVIQKSKTPIISKARV